jgi:hypothetical protein
MMANDLEDCPFLLPGRWRILLWISLRSRVASRWISSRWISRWRSAPLLHVHLLMNWCHERVQGLHQARIRVPMIKLNLVLCLHASTHTAPHEISREIQDACCLLESINADCQAREQAGQVLEKDSRCNDAIVTLGVAQLHFVLQHPPGAGHRLTEA